MGVFNETVFNLQELLNVVCLQTLCQGSIGVHQVADRDDRLVAASILTAIYHMLKDGTMYQDLGRKHFDRRSSDQQKRSLVKRLAGLGYTVELKPLAT
jgi:hypothetical protein